MYFRRFPMIYYNFGDNEANTIFPNITAYVDIIDQVKQEVSFYDKYTILDGDRPDTVSQILYDTPDFHWTFFAMNDLGQIVIASDKNGAGLNNNFGQTEQIAGGTTAEEQTVQLATLIGESEQFNAPLYYKNTSGDIVDIDPYNQITSGLVPTTVMEDNIDFNDKLKEIIIIKPDSVTSVVSEYFRLLKD